MDYRQYLGAPYTIGGQTPEEGFDCWTFVKYFLQREFDIFLDYSPTKEEVESYKASARWIKRGVEKEVTKSKSIVECALNELKPSALVMMGQGSYITHIGVYIGKGLVIHCQNAMSGGSVVIWPLERVRRQYKNLKGYNHVIPE